MQYSMDSFQMNTQNRGLSLSAAMVKPTAMFFTHVWSWSDSVRNDLEKPKVHPGWTRSRPRPTPAFFTIIELKMAVKISDNLGTFELSMVDPSMVVWTRRVVLKRDLHSARSILAAFELTQINI